MQPALGSGPWGGPPPEDTSDWSPGLQPWLHPRRLLGGQCNQPWDLDLGGDPPPEDTSDWSPGMQPKMHPRRPLGGQCNQPWDLDLGGDPLRGYLRLVSWDAAKVASQETLSLRASWLVGCGWLVVGGWLMVSGWWLVVGLVGLVGGGGWWMVVGVWCGSWLLVVGW